MFAAPVVGVVFDATGFVNFDLVAVEEPVEGGLAVDDVVVGVLGDVGDGDVGVVDDAGFVEAVAVGFLLRGGAGVGHLLDAVEVEGFESEFVAFDGDAGMGRNGLVVEVEFGEVASGLGEGLVVGGFRGERDAGEHLLEVGGEALAVFRAVEDAVDVVEDVFLGDLLSVGLAEGGEDGVGDGGLAAVAVDNFGFGVVGGEVEFAGARLDFLVKVERETLAS